MSTITTTNIDAELNGGEVSFRYTKADGTVRSARGTTNLSLMPTAAAATVSGQINESNSSKVTYYDLDKNGWRSFTRANLIG